MCFIACSQLHSDVQPTDASMALNASLASACEVHCAREGSKGKESSWRREGGAVHRHQHGFERVLGLSLRGAVEKHREIRFGKTRGYGAGHPSIKTKRSRANRALAFPYG